MNKRLNINLNWKTISLVGVIFLAWYRFYIISWQFKFFHYLVPPSPDLVAHLQMTDSFINGAGKLGTYPPLFHIITAFMANHLHIGSLGVFNLIAPFWIPLAIIIFYILVTKMFGYKVAFWSTLIFAFVSSSPLYNFADAQYADILGYNIIGPFFIIALISLIRKFKYWKLLVVFTLFALFLSAHNLSSILIYIVSFISVAVYCFVSYKTDKVQFKNAFRVLIAFCAFTVFTVILSKIFFGPLLSSAVSSLTQGSALVKNSTSAILEYDNISLIVPPFLEFIGLIGVGFLFLRISQGKARFASLLVIVWIVITWLLSRSSMLVLPQRILREIPLPLSIASGIAAVEMFSLFKNSWQKIGFFALFSYLIVINNSQVSVSPFVLPNGLTNQIWFRDIDQIKYDYIIGHLDKNDEILANSSNPILYYKLEAAGYKIVNFTSIDVSKRPAVDQEHYVSSNVKDSGAKYLFIGAMPPGVSPDLYFSQFANYKLTTDLLNHYKYPKRQLVQQFADTSKLILIK